MRARRKPVDRFWSHVDRTGDCWVWTGARDPKGYGVFQRGRELGPRRAHRWIWEHLNGRKLASDEFVCHHCDNPPCVRPDHLFIGSNADNIRDMTGKGRSWQQRKTHCPHGHEYTPENTYGERRRCKTCRRSQRRARKERTGVWV